MKPVLPPVRLPFYYGWAVIAVAFVTMAIAVNARTSFSLLFPPILDEFGWQRGVTAAAFSVGFVSSVVLGPLVGVLMDKWGPRVVIPLGATSAALGLVAATFATSPLELYVTLGVMVVGASIAMSYHVHSMFLPNWFVRRRGLAIGIAFAGVGVGAIIILPWLQTLIEAAGWRRACIAFAVVLVIVVVPLNILLQRGAPSDLGLEPDGHRPDDAGSAARRAPDTIVDREWAERHWTLRSAARTPRFWWIAGAYFTALYAWYSVQVHQTRYFVDSGFDADVAATVLGMVGMFGIVGQIGVGALSDRVGREWGWTIALTGYAACYGALIVIGTQPSLWLVYFVAAAQGLMGYGIGSLYGVISNEVFAGPRFATIFSILSLGGSMGAAAGPWLTGEIFDRTGSYASAFWLAAVLSLVSIVCIWMAAPRKVRLAAGVAERRQVSRAN
jgi:MFS family permease